MAKLKAPLLSLGASGAIGKAIVYFPWKGLNCAREYVIPANPQTDPQEDQRARLTEAVEYIHMAQASATSPLQEADTMAYALLGSTYPTPRTWFNQAVKMWIDQVIKAAGRACLWATGSVVPTPGVLTFRCRAWSDTPYITKGDIFYGTSKTALVHSIPATLAEIQAGHPVPGLTKGTKYFLQYRPDTPAGFAGANSGIYYGVPL